MHARQDSQEKTIAGECKRKTSNALIKLIFSFFLQEPACCDVPILLLIKSREALLFGVHGPDGKHLIFMRSQVIRKYSCVLRETFNNSTCQAPGPTTKIRPHVQVQEKCLADTEYVCVIYPPHCTLYGVCSFASSIWTHKGLNCKFLRQEPRLMRQFPQESPPPPPPPIPLIVWFAVITFSRCVSRPPLSSLSYLGRGYSSINRDQSRSIQHQKRQNSWKKKCMFSRRGKTKAIQSESLRRQTKETLTIVNPYLDLAQLNGEDWEAKAHSVHEAAYAHISAYTRPTR